MFTIRKSKHLESRSMSKAHRIVLLIALSVTLFLATLDAISIPTSIPSAGEALNASFQISWAASSFFVASTAFLLVYARLAEIFGRKSLLLFSISVLAIGDLMCGFSTSTGMLFFSRGLSGMGAGGINALVLIIVGDLTSTMKDSRRRKCQACLETLVVIGNGLGPVIAGAVAERASWRWTFWLLVPMTVICGVFVAVLMPGVEIEGDWKEKMMDIDYIGTLTSIGAVLLILIPVSYGGVFHSWSSPTVIAMLVSAGILLGLFVLSQWRHSLYPVMPTRIMRMLPVQIILGHNLLMGVLYFQNIFLIPVYFQSILGLSPFKSGLLVLPMVLAFSIGASTAGVIIERIGRTKPVVLTGYALWAIGASGKIAFVFCYTALPHNQVTWSAPILVIIVSQLVEGVGIGFTFQPAFLTLLATTRPEDKAIVTGLRNFFRNIGGAIGLISGNCIINNILRSKLDPALFARLKRVGGVVRKIADLTDAEKEIIRMARRDAFKIVFTLGTPIMALCFLTFLFVKEKRPEDPVEKAKVFNDTETNWTSAAPSLFHSDSSSDEESEDSEGETRDKELMGDLERAVSIVMQN